MSEKAKLIKRCEELGISTEGLTNNTEREAAIAAKEAELSAQAKTESTETVTQEAETVTESTETVTDEAETVTESTETVTQKDPKGPEADEDLEEEQEKEADFYEDDRGRKWKFKSTAPKTLNIDGHPMSQEEIFSTEEVISELVYGNCGHLTQIL